MSTANATGALEPVTEIRMYVLHEAAKALGVAQKLLRERIKNGEIRVLPWGNEKRIPAWELKRWQEIQLAVHAPDRDIDLHVNRILNGERPQRFSGKRR